MNWSLGRTLAALITGIVVVTVAVSLLTEDPIASYVLNRHFALGTVAMMTGVVLIWYQRPDADEESSA